MGRSDEVYQHATLMLQRRSQYDLVVDFTTYIHFNGIDSGNWRDCHPEPPFLNTICR